MRSSAPASFRSCGSPARALYGFAICGLFIVAQSWLNDAVGNAIRGRVMAIFYVCYIVGLGVGSFLLSFVDLATPQAPLVGIVFTALSILPVGMTRLPQPPAPDGASIAFAAAWRISPVGIAGMLAVGGLSMMIAGFAPIHATAKGFSQQEVATLMFAMPLGTLLFQIPLGWISDRTDRRYVLIATSLLVAAAGHRGKPARRRHVRHPHAGLCRVERRQRNRSIRCPAPMPTTAPARPTW